jgi:molybdopterin converting factor small subunit
MNPAEQLARHTVLAAVRGKQDDLETVLRALAAELVEQREMLEAIDTARREQGAHALAAIEELAADLRGRLTRHADHNDQVIGAALKRHRADLDTTLRAALEAHDTTIRGLRAELAAARKAAGTAGDQARAATAATTDAIATWRALPWRDRLRWLGGRA